MITEKIRQLLQDYGNDFNQCVLVETRTSKSGDDEIFARMIPTPGFDPICMEIVSYITFKCARYGAVDMWIDTYPETGEVELTFQSA